MVESRTLQMVFKDGKGKNKTISLVDPKEDIKKADVEAVMQSIIDKQAFVSDNGALTEIGDMKMRIVETLA